MNYISLYIVSRHLVILPCHARKVNTNKEMFIGHIEKLPFAYKTERSAHISGRMSLILWYSIVYLPIAWLMLTYPCGDLWFTSCNLIESRVRLMFDYFWSQFWIVEWHGKQTKCTFGKCTWKLENCIWLVAHSDSFLFRKTTNTRPFQLSFIHHISDESLRYPWDTFRLALFIYKNL